VDIEEAYRECERITWSQARNFAYGIRLLPEQKRHALAAVYAFARRVDDICDGTLPPDEKLRQLELTRAQIPSGGASANEEDPVLIALTDAGKRFAIPMPAFGELIDGCVQDVNGTTYHTWDDLYYYCRCVAGSIGRLSLGVFGATRDPERQEQMADDLGIALQLTNILRDVREDYLNGRVYLPAEDLSRFGLELKPTDNPGEPFPDPAQQARFASLVEFEADRARQWYSRGLPLVATLDRRSAACTGAMAGIYRRLLERIAQQPSSVLRGRQSLPAGEKLLVALKAVIR
jgi:15-cis-phytoene synthase